ncbi:signal peptidase complex catalytic subunit SEC11C isoform X3 [Lutra lutra]|uniref:signal peptidase complex catalytic subunit SEC11C isoform X3 n=1 Tax=Lutra lutra TaxID=9657 RepID=UPI001FD27E83|nr:signal peptidase complex catalytic subunit SEC11C isoform X3 [Lutra lutra]
MVRAGAVGTHLPASGWDIFGDLRKMNKRQLYYQVLNFAMIVSSALMIWKGLIVLTGSESPIVVVLRDNGDIKFLTKGDNNEVDDRGLYKEGQNWLEKKDVVGRARGFLPYVGMVTIIMNDYPKFKYALLAVMGAYVLLKRES